MIIIAFLMDSKKEPEIRMLGVKAVKDYAIKLGATYDKIMDGDFVYCHGCNEFHASNNFYNDNINESGLYLLCNKVLTI